MTQYFDTHAHYDSGKFNADRDEVLRAVHESGVALIVDPGDCAVTSARAVAIAQEFCLCRRRLAPGRGRRLDG